MDSSLSSNSAGLSQKIELLKHHVQVIEKLVENETDLWVTEFSSSIAALEAQLKGDKQGK